MQADRYYFEHSMVARLLLFPLRKSGFTCFSCSNALGVCSGSRFLLITADTLTSRWFDTVEKHD